MAASPPRTRPLSIASQASRGQTLGRDVSGILLDPMLLSESMLFPSWCWLRCWPYKEASVAVAAITPDKWNAFAAVRLM